MSAEARCAELSEEFELPTGSAAKLVRLLELLSEEKSSITSVRDPDQAVEVHVADSLTGLLVPQIRAARSIADLGAGAGLPGLVLAMALPEAQVTLVESVGNKASFIEKAALTLGLTNVTVEPVRAEEASGTGSFDAVTTRALGSLPLVLEYSAPLLRVGGCAVAWKGDRDEAEASAGERAAIELGLSEPTWTAVEEGTVRGARNRNLVICEKIGPTPERFPRRPGIARKRPLA